MMSEPWPINGELVQEVIELSSKYGYNINDTMHLITRFLKRYFEDKEKQLEVDKTTINYITRASTYMKVDRISEKHNITRGQVMDIISDFFLQDGPSYDNGILNF